MIADLSAGPPGLMPIPMFFGGGVLGPIPPGPCAVCMPCPVGAVPELATWLMLIFGLAGVGAWRWHRGPR